jgi:ketosteroid isomerase-like protein
MAGKIVGALLMFTCGASWAADAGMEEFNRALIQATTRMDNAAALALWEDDGIALLPQTKPIIGKKAIAKFLDDVSSQLTGARMEKFEMQCFDIERHGNVATEWCEEHQHVLLADGKPPFDGRGKMLLILHRGADGKWRMRREMWNEGVADNSN